MNNSSTVRESQRRDSLTLEEWTSVLHLSTMWQFQKIRAIAINAMGSVSMDLVDKIVIARKFDVSTWLVPALNQLVQREKSIDFLEGNRLGMGWVLKVAELRDGDIRTDETTTRTCQNCSHTGPPRCNSCNSTTANRCSSCNHHLNVAATTSAGLGGKRSNMDHSDEIRKAFGLERRGPHSWDDSGLAI
jgi:hypothetical protein